MGIVVVMMVVVVPIGPGRGLGYATAGKSSCGKKDECHTRLGNFSQCLLAES